MNKFTIQCTGKTELLHTNEIHSLLLFLCLQRQFFLGDRRSDVDSFDKRCLQGDVELLQGLQHPDQRIHQRVILNQSYVLIHLGCDGAVCKQGNPVVQKVVSDKVPGGILGIKTKPS